MTVFIKIPVIPAQPVRVHPGRHIHLEPVKIFKRLRSVSLNAPDPVNLPARHCCHQRRANHSGDGPVQYRPVSPKFSTLHALTHFLHGKHLIITAAAAHLSTFPCAFQQQISHRGHCGAKTKTLCQPKTVGTGQRRMRQGIIRATKTVDLLIPVTDQHNPAPLSQHKCGSHRIRILRFIKQNGVPSAREIRSGELKQFEIGVMGDQKRSIRIAHCLPERPHSTKCLIRSNSFHFVLVRQMLPAGGCIR